MNPNNFSKSLNYSSQDGKYSVYNFTDGSTSFDRIDSTQESICIFPFFKNEHDKIESVVLANCIDHMHDGKSILTCITQTFDQDQHSSYHSSFKDIIEKNLNLKDVNVDDIFYLGEVSHNLPFNKKYRCFSVNLSNYYDKFSDIAQEDLKFKNQKIVDLKNVKFSTLVNGNVDDSLCLSCAMLLLSYFS
jgi:hypothetical protein